MSESSLSQLVLPRAPSGQPRSATSKVLVAVVCYNTDTKTQHLLKGFPLDLPYDIVGINDGSTDRTREYLNDAPFPVIHHDVNEGVGAAIKQGIRYAIEQGYEVVVIMVGNGKDDPRLIPRLLQPLFEQGYDYVQGSRFLPGGSSENLPAFRHVMVRVHAWLFRVLTGFRGTDALNGFRAYRLSLFQDPRINIWQSWLDGYELETYLHYKVLKLGYRVCEVPVSKTYPPRHLNEKYSHIRPVIDWWRILRPLVLLILRLRR